MRILVTGAAGFIGPHLTQNLLAAGHEGRAGDCFTDSYDRTLKDRNAAAARLHPACEFLEVDLCVAPIDELLDGIDVVFHQAGQPGVRLSWANAFDTYVACNITATQRLLEGAV